jgi:hypothetical protein
MKDFRGRLPDFPQEISLSLEKKSFSMESYMTRKGSCSFGSDSIVFRESHLKYLANMVEGFWENGEMWERLFLLSAVALMSYAATYAAVLVVFAGRRIQSVLLVVLLTLGATVWIYHRVKGVTKKKAVEFDSIESVKFVEGRKAVSNPRFLINFEEDDKEKVRYLIMPNRMMPGIEDEIEAVRKEFEDRDIEVES